MIRVYWLKVHPFVALGSTNTHTELGRRVPGYEKRNSLLKKIYTKKKTRAPPLTSNKGGAEGFRDCGKGFYGFGVLCGARAEGCGGSAAATLGPWPTQNPKP